ncbi:MAG: LLM class F420-dependent oxidoreductase [Chloroflexi bacterium]|nr:LLM class F420-dependent oxidoreductase [Chloroflexota bacterium]
MKIGITVPNNWGVDDVRDVVALGQQAEELGFDSIWTMDHLLNIGFVRDRLDNKPYFHPLAVLSFLAARTTTITLGTSVMVLPYHNPIELAKYAATLDQLSGGRFVLGVGAGGTREESDALGLDFHRRGAIANEMMRVMRELWTSELPAFSGTDWRFDNLRFSPKPVQRPLPMWVGGASPGAMKRTALLGDGWHPNGLSPDNYRTGAEQIKAMAAAAGRDPGEIYLSARANIRLNPPPGAPASPFDGSSQAMVDAIREYERVGVEHVVLAPDTGNVPLLRDKMQHIAGEVIPHFRD